MKTPCLVVILMHTDDLKSQLYLYLSGIYSSWTAHRHEANQEISLQSYLNVFPSACYSQLLLIICYPFWTLGKLGFICYHYLTLIFFYPFLSTRSGTFLSASLSTMHTIDFYVISSDCFFEMANG